MKRLKHILDFYINSSIHVAFSCFALVKLTQFMFNISYDDNVSNFAFFGTIVAYNFVKYHTVVLAKKFEINSDLKAIVLLSFLSFLGALFYFFQLQLITQIVGVGFLLFTFLYTLPFFPNRKNARNWVGVKIYIVSLCWVGITLILPILDANIEITLDFYLKCVKRFILIFVLVLIFEIIDLKTDDPYLQTVPQKIGVKQTKILGILLLIVFYLLEFITSSYIQNHLFADGIVVLTIGLFLFFCDEMKSKYYTSFFVESIPVFWWILILIFS